MNRAEAAVELAREVDEWHSSGGWYCDRCDIDCEQAPDGLCPCCAPRFAELMTVTA